MLRLHHVPGDHGNHVSGHHGVNGMNVRQLELLYGLTRLARSEAEYIKAVPLRKLSFQSEHLMSKHATKKAPNKGYPPRCKGRSISIQIILKGVDIFVAEFPGKKCIKVPLLLPSSFR
ncbi:hypothetical protein DPMN_100221 [Dreissena polymorpha]|uniref:Uncharacterized protein n=1 Tax=Dreissena polymorpha TaxID=45954 RepID=A0A9D4R8Y2_DREPO|nr:hypothetical protein DPMN_100221 [Dreissena polymorpha]